MNDQELIEIYEKAYKEEYDKNLQIATTFYEQARDKEYALKLGIMIVAFISSFRNSSDLEKEISEMYDHVYKLGGTIVDTIRSIPPIVEEYKKRIEEQNASEKGNITVEYKKFLGIPYAIKQINLGKIRMASPFESLITEKEIAEELARQRSLFDLIKYLQMKYIEETKGLLDAKEKNILPTELEPLLNLKTALEVNDLETFIKSLQSVFASMSYSMKIKEGYFHSHIHLILKILGFNIESEVETNQGRIDSVIETDNYIHIIEFKLNDSAIALQQIKEKKYYQKYLTSKKKIILVGIAVDSEERNIINWQMQTFN
jgi:hypothetical protein